MIWKFESIILIFFYFLPELSNKVLFAHCCCYCKELKYLNFNLMQNVTQIFQPFWNSIDSVQKALDLYIAAKNRRKMRIIDLNFQIKKLISLASRLFWNWPSKLTIHSLVFIVKCKCPNGYSVQSSALYSRFFWAAQNNYNA